MPRMDSERDEDHEDHRTRFVSGLRVLLLTRDLGQI